MRHTSLSAIFFFLLYLQNDETLLCVNELDGNAFKFNQNDNKKKKYKTKYNSKYSSLFRILINFHFIPIYY